MVRPRNLVQTGFKIKLTACQKKNTESCQGKGWNINCYVTYLGTFFEKNEVIRGNANVAAWV